ncbi:hypothetical protein PHMEG_00019926 [Phytophthora megakarya]|uniref:Uncharacterized protein n=1 Tax=Phytophthora megakarya TaxID=4795 RepID=A0A225VQ43_9STRA|nr:hypothetical protein PHMEG_00019926 [Phytophthora megakarya]
MRESLEKELADDDFMLGLTAEGSVAGIMDVASRKKGSHSPLSSTNTVAEVSVDCPTGDGNHALTGEDSVVEAPVEAGAPVDDAHASQSSVIGAPGLGLVHSLSPLPPCLSLLLNDVNVDLAELEPSDSHAKNAEACAADVVSGTESSVSHYDVVSTAPAVSTAPGSAVSPKTMVVPARTRARSQRADGVHTQPASTLRHVWDVGAQDTSAFVPAATVVSRAPNSRKRTATAERFLEPGLAAVGAQKAWCQMLNVSLSESSPKDHASPLDFAFLVLIHPWRVPFDRMPDEPLTFGLGQLVQGVRISIRASGHGGLVRMWRRFSGHCYVDNEKIDLCVALWERRHWVQVSTLVNAIHRFKEDSDPLDPFTHVILGMWYHLNRIRNNRADLLRQHIDRLWEWCTSAGGRTHTLPTEVLLEHSYLQYSTEVLEWTPDTTDWFRELQVLDAKQPWGLLD